MGAWWLGYLIAGVITLLAAIPFWFLPRSLPLSGPRRPPEDSPLQKHKYPAESKTTFVEMAKGEEALGRGGVDPSFSFSSSTSVEQLSDVYSLLLKLELC